MMKIKSEYDFLYFMYQQDKDGKGIELYPRVMRIPKGDTIRPDIDLLLIDKEKNPFWLRGFEFKLIKKRNEVFQCFYKGLGQSLCYFQYGIDHVNLVLGIFNMGTKEIEQIEYDLRLACTSIRFLLRDFSYGLEIELYREDKSRTFTLYSPPRPRLYFPGDNPKSTNEQRLFEEVRNKKNYILQRDFAWAKNWLKIRNLDKNNTNLKYIN